MKFNFQLYVALISALIGINNVQIKAQEKQGNIIKKTINRFLSSENDSTRRGSFMVVPAAGYAQETGFEYGLASAYDFYLDKSDLSNRTSNILLTGTLTTKKQKNIKLVTDLWTKDNDYHIISELRYRDWPFNYYGLGSNTWKENEDKLEQKLIRAKLDVEKKLASKFYAGLNLTYEHVKFTDVEQDGIFDQTTLTGKAGGQHLALGLSALYDSRDRTTYTTKGYYARIKYAYSPDFWGKENFTGSQLQADVRGFKPFNNKLAAAAQILYRGTYGKTTPFYMYEDLGGDMTMRGYYLGRYKDKNYATLQAELRYRFMARFGITGFAATGSTFSNEHKARMITSFGGGLRYFYSLEHNSSLRFDYAVGEQRKGEKRQTGFYLSISEAF